MTTKSVKKDTNIGTPQTELDYWYRYFGTHDSIMHDPDMTDEEKQEAWAKKSKELKDKWTFRAQRRAILREERSRQMEALAKEYGGNPEDYRDNETVTAIDENTAWVISTRREWNAYAAYYRYNKSQSG